MSDATPMRQSGTRTPEGWVLLRDVELDYLDGAEDQTLQLLRSSTDLSSTSDELVERATDWTQRYNVHPGRANVMRAFELPESATVLEVGAGCGPVTRYLGERCAVVDALEPVPERARVARERTRDLPNVEVFVGDLDDVPAVPTYDVVVVVGVLEWSSGGTADVEPYVSFLRKIRQVLRPGGALVLAIENKLGVKYLAGAAEDHTGRPFDGLEGYARSSRARTFSRPELENLFDMAGLSAQTRIAFPDYKLTRTVLDPARLTGDAGSLLHRIPNFPSPDWFGTAVSGADEGLLWRSLCDAGMAAETGNSFVVLATANGEPVGSLWPEDRAGIYFTPDRRAAFAVATDVRLRDGHARFERSAEPNHRAVAGFRVEVSSADFVGGRDFVDEFIDVDDARSRALLEQWAGLVDRYAASDDIPIDLVPHNLVVDARGVVQPIDDEWRAQGGTASALLQRGVLTLALRLAQRSIHDQVSWKGCSTVRDVVARIGTVVGLPADGQWIDATLEREVEQQCVVTLPPVGETVATAPAVIRRAYEDALAAAFPTEPREGAASASLIWERDELRGEVARLERDVTELGGEVTRLSNDVSDLVGEVTRLGQKDAELAELRAAFLDGRRWIGHLEADLVALRQELDAAQKERADALYEASVTYELLSSRDSDRLTPTEGPGDGVSGLRSPRRRT
ncbi:class I SAM-dependent methyltransferase [Cellulomonas fengjieae]|uniref:class I SAM-dependent methyltransferase n=1 Tax=Cellulomonas fengjieae TaxID=2819978 RepID=UPI001AAE75B9|nr:class I SAM-dependent methyltransferase [Cellulomonas fengjieae]MBO3101391.1 methyltransferase domain-containing protein [Cellulomonas fengjieae]